MAYLVSTVVLALTLVIALVVWQADRRKLGRSIREVTASRDRWQAKAENYSQKLDAVSETSGAAVVMHDRSSTILHANTKAEKMFGSEPQALVGKSLIQGTLSREIAEFGLHVSHTHKADAKDVLMPGSLGQILRVCAFPLFKGLSGEPEVMLVIVDVTELRRLETIRRDFVANVSHELRTPLASIRAMAETLAEGALHDEKVAPRFLGTIVTESDRLARISEDLLILSDAESKEPEKEWFDLSRLIDEVAVRWQAKAKEAKTSLNVQMPESLQVRASRDQLEQVVVNLVDNAIKYTSEGGHVSVSARRENGSAIVEVSDTGIGIMEEDLPRVFERFYRVDKARSRASGGTGLGLSIVKNIIESHNGEVRVSSVFNHGSTFTFVLPIEAREEKDATHANPV